MKLDTKALRYLTPEDWRVLTAVQSLAISRPPRFQLLNLRVLTVAGRNGK